MLNYLHILTRILVTYLNIEEQQKVVDNFNYFNNEVIILIVMYTVSAQELNLNFKYL